MRQVVIAFATTGPSTRDGGRLRELLAVELSDGKATGNRLHQTHSAASRNDGRSFAEQFEELDAFIGNARVIVHHGALWRQFMRAELRDVKKPSARRLLRDFDDVMAWAHQRFPKQRKDLASLGRKVGVAVGDAVAGIQRDADLLVGIANAMKQPAAEAHAKAAVSSGARQSPDEATVPPFVQRSLGERLSLCWRVLTGQA